MHMHGTQLDPNAATLYGVLVAQKAAASRRAAEVRDKLMSSTGEVEDELDSGSVSAADIESNPPPQDKRRRRFRKRAPDSEATPANPVQPPEEENPVSIWG
ncbi:MAG: hypothetical protein P4M01_11445 [Acidobacteriota bacterium]|nr:hypothetical protein [Acidobacteriota bacterium]